MGIGDSKDVGGGDAERVVMQTVGIALQPGLYAVTWMACGWVDIFGWIAHLTTIADITLYRALHR